MRGGESLLSLSQKNKAKAIDSANQPIFQVIKAQREKKIEREKEKNSTKE